MPLVCLSLTAKTIAENLAVLDRYRGKIDIAELRADLLDPSEAFAVRDFPVIASLPCILAVRRKCDGGNFVDGEGKRLVMLAKAIAYARPDQSANYAYVDLESDFRVPSVEEACHTFGTRIIRSRHDILGMPADLDAAWAELAAEPDEIPKLAVTPRGAGDFARLFTWASSLPAGERIIVGMGEFGVASRVLAERVGSCIAYTSALRAGLPGAAPGHLDPAALEEIYRFRELDRSTTVYALGGGVNVLTSKTPQLHNAAFKAAGLNAVYVPMPASDPGAFLLALEATSAQGAAITVPLKEALLPYLSRRSPEVDDIGACNTLIRERDGWMGHDTDAQGFERALVEFMDGSDHSTELVAAHSDIVIQATSVGMDGERQGDPLDWFDFTGREAVFDLIYRPERSLLLERAASAGCKTTNGWKMLRYQSAAQFAIWTGLEPPASYFS